MMTRRSARLSIKAESPASEAPTDEPEDVIFCPWVQLPPDQIPPLVLPESSSDLLIESEILFPAIEIYETCINYYRVIQISPFLFEEFCCALRSPDQTRLLAEIHIAFVRLFFRDDEDNQTTFTSQDTNNCYNVMLQLLDGMTYAEILRYYLDSDPRFQCEHILDILRQNYPFVDVEKRITVLKWLCDFFLETYAFRQLISNEGLIAYDDCCRACGKAGDVMLCDGCEACYHVECANLKEVPAERWFCQICQLHCGRDSIDVKDLSDSMAHHKYRVEPLGFDRHKRVYWFLVKRIFVQDIESGTIYYYSTLPQFYELVKQLDPHHFEKNLCANIMEKLDEIERQMRLTLTLTRKYRDLLLQKIGATRETPYSYLDVNNSFRMASIISELNGPKVKTELNGDIKMENGVDGDENMEIDGKDASIDLLATMRKQLHIDDNNKLTDTFWSGGLDHHDLIKMQQTYLEELKIQNGCAPITKMKLDNLQRGYRLVFSDGRYRYYQNEYSTNDFAKSYKARSKERDKKKYLSARFALTEEGEFSWALPKGRDVYGSEPNVCKIMQMTIKRFIERIPEELLHRLWRVEKQRFLEKLFHATSVHDLRYLILQLERAIRKPLFSNVWWNSLGITKLMRTTSDDREERSKLETQRKKEEKALQSADPNVDTDIVFVKYLKPRPAALWRLRDEGFRLNNRHQMGGWLWFSSTLVRDIQKPAGPPPLGIDYYKPVTSETPVAVRKAIRLYNIARKLARWRDITERREGALNGHLFCYSPVCYYNPLGFSLKLRCYNPNCPRLVCEFDTTMPSKAYRSGIRVDPKPPTKQMMLRKNVQGEGSPFPFPTPLTFLARAAKKRSLLIIPQASLKRLARQGGLNANQYLPGFNKQAKNNNTVWIYPCPRPLFDHCWRYMTLNATTLHALALSLRTMYSCIRWAEMHPTDESDGRVVTHMPDHDERRLVISHKEHPPDGYYEQYKLRIQILSIDYDGNDEDDSTSYHTGGSKRTTRKRKAPKNKLTGIESGATRRVTGTKETWIDGVDLKPFEIVHYWKRFNAAVMSTTRPPAPASIGNAATMMPPPAAATRTPVGNAVAAMVPMRTPQVGTPNIVTPNRHYHTLTRL